ncbi:adenylate/guanylate cyclase domain-containing protein [Sulfurimonas sp. SAG-AH-194-I05]|nr:adenylate/guanylate cyclase domain-containing protein [Sulfurimonas sp. SAG-AH-194-I05]
MNALFLQIQDPKEASPHVVIVDVDAVSIDKLGQWPFSRDIISQVLINLKNSGAGIIGFDMVFSNPDRLSPHAMAKSLNIQGSFVNNDILLANTLSQTPVILGYFFDMANKNMQTHPKHLANINIKGPTPIDTINEAYGVVDNIKVLKNAAYSSGYFNLTNITSGIVDSAPLLIKYEEKLYPSLALEMLRIASSKETIEVINSETGITGLYLDDLVLPTDPHAQIKLNFRGKGFSYKYISFYDILTSHYQEEDVQGKFILIGASDIGLNDLVTTLYDAAMPGVEVHATTIDNLLNSDFYYTPHEANTYGMFMIFFSTIMVGVVLYILPASWSIFIFFSSLSLLVYSQYYLIFSKHIIINFTVPLFALFATTGIFALLSYYYENKQKTKIYNKLSTKVSKNVAEEILKSDSDVLSISKKEVTVFFSDIRSFTKLSEELQDPEKLIKILNTYMSPMVTIITEHRGTVDKFIGDAIMAYWNAPLEQTNHADLAVQSALKQLKALTALNKTLKRIYNVELQIGIGINSGEAIVGEMGSAGRSDYTLIGDTVNLASRVESLTKKYNVPLIITAQTKNLLKGNYHIEKLDIVRVKGKTEETILYKVLS